MMLTKHYDQHNLYSLKITRPQSRQTESNDERRHVGPRGGRLERMSLGIMTGFAGSQIHSLPSAARLRGRLPMRRHER